MSQESSATGKVRPSVFKDAIFPSTGASRPEVMIGPSFGVDVSVVSLPDGNAMVMTSDPLSLIPTLGLRESAWLSVQLMANDMATTGFAPQYGQFILNLPTSLTPDDFKEYWHFIHQYCERIGVAITGGHTGRFEGQNSSVCGGGTFISIVPAAKVITSNGARPGDVLLMTKSSALIATSILCLSFPKTVTDKLGKEVCETVSALFYETSALEAGLVAGTLNNDQQAVSAMHDVTECGVLGAAYEMAKASGTGVEIRRELIPVSEPQQQVCDLFGIDPHISVGAGAMLMSVDPRAVDQVKEQMATHGILVSEIGRISGDPEEFLLYTGADVQPLVHPGEDPYWEAFLGALKRGWK